MVIVLGHRLVRRELGRRELGRRELGRLTDSNRGQLARRCQLATLVNLLVTNAGQLAGDERWSTCWSGPSRGPAALFLKVFFRAVNILGGSPLKMWHRAGVSGRADCLGRFEARFAPTKYLPQP